MAATQKHVPSPARTKPRFPVALLLGCLLHFAATGRADEEQDLIALLQSTATATQKSAACQKLRVIGTTRSVPALASLLSDESTSHSARHALEGLPFPEAGAALRTALTTTRGMIQAGVIDSLGWRRDAESVRLLTPFLSSTNLDITASAAVALGRIGGQDAVVALNAVSDQASLALRSTVQESLLQCAERLHSDNRNDAAAAVYQRLFAKPASESIRVAAWRGLVLVDAGQRPGLVPKALAGSDRPIQLAALEVVRELGDAALIAAGLPDWTSLPAGAQLALLDAHARFGNAALPTVRNALASPHLGVRVAALEALADLGDPSAIPALTRAAAHGEAAEREAARDTLTRVRGPGVREALLAGLETAEPPGKAELLRALGERDDRQAATVLLQHAGAAAEPVRLAALESLRRLALPDTLTPLLDLAAKSESEDQLDPVLKALSAVCQASPNKEQTQGRVIKTVEESPPTERRRLLPLLAELGTAEALTAVQAAARDPNPELARQAVRVLTQWPNASPAPYLMDLAQSSPDPILHALALRGGIEVSGQEPDAAKRLALLERAMGTARRAEEKKQALAQIAQLPSPEALPVVLKELANPDLVNEAGLAAVSIAEKLAPAAPTLADEAAVKVLAQCKAPEIVRRAWAIRRMPAAAGAFIRDWLICGPYRQAGVDGAQAVFNLAFGPEEPGRKVDWKPLPPADHVSLAQLFPDQANCVAYLRAQIVAPDNLDALLLMGSDDGLKAWLNSEVVHSNNADRGEVLDQDRAPIKLKKGANQLLLKVTQGGGGWSVSARIVGANGQPIAGLRVEPPKP